MTENLLRHEASPYLLQHKDNPVHWRPWGRAALDEASREQKPILLSVGYAACHWCHVMAHESFDDPDIAALMNRVFVNIKVDREERPDVDQIYMAALHELGEQGGWPLTMFLTPDGSPIWGGTYFPPTTRYGRPGFPDVIREVARVFYEEPDKIAHNRSLLLDRLSQPPPPGTIALDDPLLDHAADRLLSLMDRERGGTRSAPKFPQPSLLELFWRAGERTGRPEYTEIVVTTLRNICAGGIFDHIGGGFARYSVDSQWLVPHFEKMLYDNAQLIDLLALAHVRTGDPLFATRIAETISWLDREMTVEGGAFAASLDADSEGHEGRFYVWSTEEVSEVLGAEEGAFFADHYDITPNGNWEGVSIPNRLSRHALLDAEIEERLTRDRDTLLARRELRPRPTRDDKILADWNGLAIAALANAGRLLERRDWLEIAIRTYRRIFELMGEGDRMAHSYRAGKRVTPGLATDHAAMIKAALSLHMATFDANYIADAERLTATLRTHHWDADNPGYFLSADDADALIVRPRSNVDEATPSANAMMGNNLIRLWRLAGDETYREDIDAMLESSAGAIAENLFAAAGSLNALDMRLRAIDIVVVRPAGADTEPMLDEISRNWSPTMVLSLHDDATNFADPHPAAGKRAIDGKVTVYVCRGETCSLPITDPGSLRERLA